MPSEWTPLIEHDIETQRVNSHAQQSADNNTRPSQLFSDAYFSGMPAKKRKLFGPNELHNDSLFKTVLGRTLKQVQLKTSVAESEIAEAGLSNTELTSEFDAELDAALSERVRNDPEFTSTLNMNTSDDGDAKLDDVVYNRNRFALSRKRLNK
jgi:hypothetical protein